MSLFENGGSMAHRSGFISIASMISVAMGIIGVALCAIVLDLFISKALNSFPFINLIILPLNGFGILFGGAVIVLSIIHIVIGYILWRSIKSGGMGALVIASVDIGSYLAFVLAVPSILLTASPILITALILISATIAGWYNLH